MVEGIESSIILGTGAGHCRLAELAELLSRQPDCRVTYEEPPWLPWSHDPRGPGIRERLARWRESRHERFMGDAASFYLPHIEEAIACEPDIRIVCLRASRDDVVADFVRELDETHSPPTNHWARIPASGWGHDPFRTRLFPQYDTSDREEGIRRYWNEYYSRVDALSQRFPENLRQFDAATLADEAGVREILAFIGIAGANNGASTDGARNAEAGHSSAIRPRTVPVPRPKFNGRFDPRRCVVQVPHYDSIHAECEQGLDALERRGYAVRRVGGHAQIDHARNQMATDALRDGFEETLWIDSDVLFEPDAVDRLRTHPHGVVGGLYARKGAPGFACHLLPGTRSVNFGERGGLLEVLYLGTGFLLVRRDVYLAVQEKCQLAMCNERFGMPLIPFFQPFVRPIDDGHWYLGEDFAFCHRVRQCGYKIYADSTIRLGHIGRRIYTWEDASGKRDVASSYEFITIDHQHAGNRLPMPPVYRRTAQVASFAADFPWPAEKPVLPAFPERNWLMPATQGMLWHSVPQTAKLLIELGSWTGRSTRFLADLAPSATVVAIDHWRGSPEHIDDPELRGVLPRLYETFLSECWEYRERVIPLRAGSVEGLRAVAEAGLAPDAIYIDADHRYESVVADLTAALDLYPQAIIVGDDWNWEGVSRGVEAVLKPRGLRCEVLETAWRVVR